MIRVGTSGFGYHEWSPSFYPPGLCYQDYLEHYARHFSCCELSHTFFHMPSSRNLSRLVQKVPETFRFTVKLHRRFTHERGTDLQLGKAFARSMAPLTESGHLGPVLAQFPFSFLNSPHNRAYVCRLRAALELPLVVELRNESWKNPETLAFLQGWGIGLAAIDAPVLGGFMPPMAIATSTIGYARFHGRDPATWWLQGNPRRYDYRYRQRELMSWVPRIREIARSAEETFVFFNNHRRANAVANAESMSRLLHRSRKRVSSRANARAG